MDDADHPPSPPASPPPPPPPPPPQQAFFAPTDVELIENYLRRKNLHEPLPDHRVTELETFYMRQPGAHAMARPRQHSNEWYFFVPPYGGVAPRDVIAEGFISRGRWVFVGTHEIFGEAQDPIGRRDRFKFYPLRNPRKKMIHTGWYIDDYALTGPVSEWNLIKMWSDDPLEHAAYAILPDDPPAPEGGNNEDQGPPDPDARRLPKRKAASRGKKFEGPVKRLAGSSTKTRMARKSGALIVNWRTHMKFPEEAKLSSEAN